MQMTGPALSSTTLAGDRRGGMDLTNGTTDCVSSKRGWPFRTHDNGRLETQELWHVIDERRDVREEPCSCKTNRSSAATPLQHRAASDLPKVNDSVIRAGEQSNRICTTQGYEYCVVQPR